jgi:hypothetical protein
VGRGHAEWAAPKWSRGSAAGSFVGVENTTTKMNNVDLAAAYSALAGWYQVLDRGHQELIRRFPSVPADPNNLGERHSIVFRWIGANNRMTPND